MGTGVLCSLVYSFPYGALDHPARRILFLLPFSLNWLFLVFVGGCTVGRYVMFPEVRLGV